MSYTRPAHQPSDGAPDDSNDYEAILSAVMETARGRWFVAEFGRRNRHAETDRVLSALRRLERRVATSSVGVEAHPDIADLGAIFGLPPRDGAAGLTGGAVADKARDTGSRADAMRDAVLSARGALRGLTEGGADARLCDAVDRAMISIDALAEAQAASGRKLEELADVISLIRDRVASLIETQATVADDPPCEAPFSSPVPIAADPVPLQSEAQIPAAAQPSPAPIISATAPADEDDIFADGPPAVAPFETGLPIEPVGAGARLRLAIADEEQALRDLASRRPAGPEDDPRTLSDLDRLTYEQRYALFAS
ncbi:MAG: hypothetical protein ABWZ80_09985 [Beijerinckiaceae bacterium]